MEMGNLDAKICQELLGRFNWDVSKATNFLLGGLK
jgi:hypothetical protein